MAFSGLWDGHEVSVHRLATGDADTGLDLGESLSDKRVLHDDRGQFPANLSVSTDHEWSSGPLPALLSPAAQLVQRNGQVARRPKGVWRDLRRIPGGPYPAQGREYLTASASSGRFTSPSLTSTGRISSSLRWLIREEASLLDRGFLTYSTETV